MPVLFCVNMSKFQFTLVVLECSTWLYEDLAVRMGLLMSVFLCAGQGYRRRHWLHPRNVSSTVLQRRRWEERREERGEGEHAVATCSCREQQKLKHSLASLRILWTGTDWSCQERGNEIEPTLSSAIEHFKLQGPVKLSKCSNEEFKSYLYSWT